MSEKLNLQLDDAIARGAIDEVVNLVERGADIEYRDPLSWTPLMNAAWVGSVEILNYLLKRGANMNSKNDEGLTALELIKAIGHNRYGHDAVIAILENTQS